MSASDSVLARLRENAGANLRAIEELTKFSDRARTFSLNADDPGRFAYLLISGHPSTLGRPPTVVLGGNPAAAGELFEHLPSGPHTILETPRDFLKDLEKHLPKGANVYFERRMEVLRSQFRPHPSSRVRQLVESDDLALAKFMGAPPQAAPNMRGWIRGAKALLGIFEGSELLSMGSTFCAIPEGWSLVGIKTREDRRRQGLAAEVTSALCARAFEEARAVYLTVLSDNAPAISLYQKLGFELQEERVWIDCGSGSKPF